MKYLLALFLLIPHFALSSEGRIINVFYDGDREELALNVVHPLLSKGFIRTNQVYLRSSSVPGCESDCMAKIRGMQFSRFGLYVNLNLVADVTANEADNRLNRVPFELKTVNGRVSVVILLDELVSAPWPIQSH